jgi:hypothetical protein
MTKELTKTSPDELKITYAKPYLMQMLEEREGQKVEQESITEQKGWLSPGSQIRRLIEAGERLEQYRMENYDEYYFGDEEPSLDPIRRAEDIQDEMLIIQNRIERQKTAFKNLEEKLKERKEKEAEIQAKKEQEQIDKIAKRTAELKEELKTKTDPETP